MTLASWGVLGTAAYAADGPDMEVAIPSTTVVYNGDGASEGPGKTIRVDVTNNGTAQAAGITVTIDTSNLDRSKVSVEFDEYCQQDGDVATCELAWMSPKTHQWFLVFVSAKTPEVSGDVGTLKASVETAAGDVNAANNTVSKTVTVRETPVADLVTFASDVYTKYDGTGGRVAPGQTADLWYFIYNSGSMPTDDLSWTIQLPEYTSFAAKPENCAFKAPEHGVPASVECSVPANEQGIGLAPGEAIGWTEYPVKVKVDADAPGAVTLTGGMVAAMADQVPPQPSLTVQATPTDGVGHPATKQELSKLAAEDDNVAYYSLETGPASADLAVKAVTVSGAVGATVNVPIELVNNGPTEAVNTVVTVVAPSGTRWVGVEDICTEVTAGVKYTCELGTYPVEASTGQFKLKIESATIGSDGLASVKSDSKDSNPANNSAKITVTTTGGSGGGLPITGAKAGLYGGIGAAVLLGGAVLFLIARRRRVVLVSDGKEDGTG